MCNSTSFDIIEAMNRKGISMSSSSESEDVGIPGWYHAPNWMVNYIGNWVFYPHPTHTMTLCEAAAAVDAVPLNHEIWRDGDRIVQIDRIELQAYSQHPPNIPATSTDFKDQGQIASMIRDFWSSDWVVTPGAHQNFDENKPYYIRANAMSNIIGMNLYVEAVKTHYNTIFTIHDMKVLGCQFNALKFAERAIRSNLRHKLLPVLDQDEWHIVFKYIIDQEVSAGHPIPSYEEALDKITEHALHVRHNAMVPQGSPSVSISDLPIELKQKIIFYTFCTAHFSLFLL